jgi:hypothetical protein
MNNVSNGHANRELSIFVASQHGIALAQAVLQCSFSASQRIGGKLFMFQ